MCILEALVYFLLLLLLVAHFCPFFFEFFLRYFFKHRWCLVILFVVLIRRNVLDISARVLGLVDGLKLLLVLFVLALLLL